MDSKLKDRLREGEIGRPFTDESHGLMIHSDGTCEVWFACNPSKVSDLRLHDFVLIYDFLRDVWFGGRVIALDIPRVGVADRRVELYQEKVVAMVDELEKGHAESIRGNQLVGIELLSIVDKQGTRMAPVFPPSNASVLLLPTIIPKTKSEPTLQQILDLPADGIRCGVVSHNQHVYWENTEHGDIFLDYCLELSKIQNRHLLVLGTSGSGKTVFLKHLAWRLANQGKAVVIADLQGDIIQLTEAPSHSQLMNLNEIERKIWEYWGWSETDALPKEKIQIYAPVSKNEKLYDREELNLVETWAKKRNITFEKFSIKFSEIVSGEELALYMPGLTDAAVGGLVDLFELYCENTQPSERTFDHFCYYVKNAKSNQRQVYWTGKNRHVKMHTMTYGNLQRELNTLRTWGVFDSPDTTRDLRYSDFVRPGTVTVLYLQHLNVRLKHIFEFFVSDFMFKNRKDMSVKEKVLIIDEAHEVIPRRAYGYEDNWIRLIARNFSEIAREGRKYHLDLLISTHKPGDINPVVYGISGTRVIFRLPHEDIEEAGVPRELRPVVKNFGPGFCIIHSPENTRTGWVEVKVPPINCLHISPQEFFEKIEIELQEDGSKAT